MPKTPETVSPALPHLLRCDSRSQLSLSGVTDVESFDETTIVSSTSAGTLVIRGTDLHVGVLSLDAGELQVSGRIDSLTYEDDGSGKSGVFSRLFR